MSFILTAYTGTNADLLPIIFSLYVEPNSIIADVTFGRGVFWKNINESEYNILKFDLAGLNGAAAANFANLPIENSFLDCLIIDPPYMHGGETIKHSINKCYRNANTSHESVVRLYAGGLLEAARVLKKKGKIIIKCQDEIESGKQRFSHIEIIKLLELFGFAVLDLFVLVQQTKPAMRNNYQKTARKNHSYAIVAEFRR